MLHFCLKSKSDEISVRLPSSKSEANRLLILQAQSNPEAFVIEVDNQAGDTKILASALAQLSQAELRRELDLNLHDAGTAVRFMTALCAIRGQSARISGTARMHQRPIGHLVEALQQLGCQIDYLAEAGHLPLHLAYRLPGSLLGEGSVRMRADVSSQFVSALLLAGPLLPKGLVIELEGPVGSKPYIDMTLALMRHTGLDAGWQDHSAVYVRPGKPAPGVYPVEPDWSAASYAYGLCGLLGGQICLPGLRLDSLQGDAVVALWMARLGVATRQDTDGLHLSAVPILDERAELDFSHCPDLAQTLVVYCVAKGIRLRARGLQSLRIKETDRIAALQAELANFGCWLEEVEPGVFATSGKAQAPSRPVATYRDHRMAMSFAMMAALFPIEIEHPEVVAKSFPSFWEQLGPWMAPLH